MRALELAHTPERRRRVRQLLAQYHYRGFHGAVGENVQYLATDVRGRELAVMVFGAAAWKVAVRDRFISWSVAQRQQRLGALANQQRFLILPWVRVAHLVSHLLARATRRLSADWEARYGHPVWLVKTFVSRTVLPARPTKPRVGYPWDRLPGGPGRIASEPCIAPSNQSGCERSTPLFAPT